LVGKLKKPFIFNMFQSIPHEVTLHSLGKIPRDAQKDRGLGYPQVWRKLWITPTPLWTRAGAILLENSKVFSIG
jgi:hypothetical protein